MKREALAYDYSNMQDTSSHDSNSLWVALSEFGDGDLFGLYSKILSELLIQDEDSETREEDIQSEVENLVLPSDKEWRLKQYFDLVHIQRSFNETRNLEATPLLKELEGVLSEAVVNNELSNSTLVRAISPTNDEADWWALANAGAGCRRKDGPTPVHVKTATPAEWEPMEVAKAARLVQKPPLLVEFESEQEMRRVYALIYDVFRYKTIVNQALDDVGFFAIYPDERSQPGLAWLFVVEMARCGWQGRRKRDSASDSCELDCNPGYLCRLKCNPGHVCELNCTELNPGGSCELEEDAAGLRTARTRARVWEQRVHFAAAFAKLRIKHNAFTLTELLPQHLRDGRITNALQKNAITGWVNLFKSRGVSELIQQLSALGYSYSSARALAPYEYRFDRVCSRFITIRPPCCDSFAKSSLVRNGIIVIQEREFCEGASMFCRAVRRCALRGDVAQTHATSPRATAYLAARLRELSAGGAGGAPAYARCPLAADVAFVRTLFVFGLGDKAEEYESILRDLGVSVSRESCMARAESAGEVCLVPEGVCGSSLRGVVAALATPPNSYSAVADPVDLVCGRGGDLEMIEILTESEVDSKGRGRVAAILEEQKKTLKFLMSKPQIQLVLYETHSALDAENGAMATRAVSEYNRLARLRHARVRAVRRPRPATARATTATHSICPETEEGPGFKEGAEHADGEEVVECTQGAKRTEGTAKCTEDVNAECVAGEEPSRAGDAEGRVPREPDDECRYTEVPKCDLFELKRLPNLGNGIDINLVLERDGCYLGLIQRKEVTRLDAKYMIRMAEERGLFGGTGAAESGSEAGEGAGGRKARRSREHDPTHKKRRFSKLEVERISAPTYSSMLRSTQHEPSCAEDTRRADSPIRTEVECCERFIRRIAAAEAVLRPCSIASCECGKRDRRKAAISANVTTSSAYISTDLTATPVRPYTANVSRVATDSRPATANSNAATTRSGPATSAETGCRPSFPVTVHDMRLEINHKPTHCFKGKFYGN